MDVIIDPDVKSVLQFMQSNVPASKLLAVADGVADLARLLWEHYKQDEIELLRIKAAPISLDDPHTQPASSERRLVA